MADRLRAIGLVLLGLALPCLGVGAEPAPLPDPTRPPHGAVVAPGGVAAGADPAGDDEEPAPVLSSIMIPAGGKPLAVIDGKVVRVGDTVGEAKVVRITETGVVLKGAQGTETLRMTPGVEKKMIRNAAAKGRARVEKP
jgi:MSHA biogenesis protein MshK